MISKLHLRRSGRAILLAIAPVATMWVASIATAQQVPVSGGPVDPQLIEDLVAANRVLADQGVLDGWGHVSVRHPLGDRMAAWLVGRQTSAVNETRSFILRPRRNR